MKVAGWNGGFDVVLGNPPWERIKIQEKEWFAQRDPEIAGARNAAARTPTDRRTSKTLDPNPVYKHFAGDKRQAEGKSQFIRKSWTFSSLWRGRHQHLYRLRRDCTKSVNGAGALA